MDDPGKNLVEKNNCFDSGTAEISCISAFLINNRTGERRKAVEIEI
jgi:hypothetical protein